MKRKPLLVVGGGPAGMLAAIAAGRTGMAVLLLEKKPEIGRKLLLTGGGRCNLTNLCDLETMVANIPGNGRFLYTALNRFGPRDLCRFFSELGLPTVMETDGRVFPQSGQARDVLAALRREMDRSGVVVHTGLSVTGLLLEHGTVAGVQTSTGDMPGRAVVLATGGMTYPETGSTGDGYGLALAVGHSLVAPRPSLIPLETAETWSHKLQGLSLTETRAVLLADGLDVEHALGELVFTHWGISGPLVSRLSRTAVPFLTSRAKLSLLLDLSPHLKTDDLESLLLDRLNRFGRRRLGNSLAGLLPERLLAVVAAEAEVAVDKPSHQVTRDERSKLCRVWRGLPLTIVRSRPPKEGVVTAGGIETKEISPRTMGSLIIPGLYIAGELLDVDGYTGGFNLQAAFSTGRLAGLSAAESLD